LNDSEQYGDIWTSLWPDTGKGWKEDWCSFPLVNVATELPGEELERRLE
jgi:hypothetical protein